MLSVVIYVNPNNIINDNQYEYYKLGFPFMANLGKVILNYEKKRKRLYKPNLSKLKKINYYVHAN
jgi:hypothetical protein